MDAEKIFRKIARNKHREQSREAAIKKHEELVKKYWEAVKANRSTLERRAFAGMRPRATSDPLGDVKRAIRGDDTGELKQAAFNAYRQNHLVAVKLASEFDQDLRDLIDHLETFGELQSPPIRIFIDLALAPPGE
jgi:hypothetical protein